MELLPCPFCGSNYILLNTQPTPIETIYYITCYKCNISTNPVINEENAIKYWNTRHSPWISVKDKLPDEEKEYLTLNKFKKIEIKYFLKSLNTFGDQYLTHWMNMPNLPENE